MSEAPTQYDSLKSEIDSYIDYSRRWMRFWGAAYYIIRTSLVVLSACVAAKDSLTVLARFTAIMSLLVAIGTALDTWLDRQPIQGAPHLQRQIHRAPD